MLAIEVPSVNEASRCSIEKTSDLQVEIYYAPKFLVSSLSKLPETIYEDDNRINALATQIEKCVQVILDPFSNLDEKTLAEQKCNDFQWNSLPMDVVKVSMLLAFKSLSSAGFRFLEVLIKHKWEEIPERDDIKEALLQFCSVKMDTVSFSYYELLEESLANVFTEIMLKDWPQLWPKFWESALLMLNINSMPFYTFQRLIEEVVIYQNVDNLEKRDELQKLLNAISPMLLDTIFNRLQYLPLPNEIRFYKKQCVAALKFLLVCIELVNINRLTFFEKETTRIALLFSYLEKDYLKFEAMNCIIQLLQKKGLKLEERVEVERHIFRNENLAFLNKAIVEYPTIEVSIVAEAKYLWNICELICCLATSKLIVPCEFKKDHGYPTYLLKMAECINKLGFRKELHSVVKSACALSEFLMNILDYKIKNNENFILYNKTDDYIFPVVERYLDVLSTPYKIQSDNQHYFKLKSCLDHILRSYEKLNSKVLHRLKEKITTSFFGPYSI